MSTRLIRLSKLVVRWARETDRQVPWHDWIAQQPSSVFARNAKRLGWDARGLSESARGRQQGRGRQYARRRLDQAFSITEPTPRPPGAQYPRRRTPEPVEAANEER